MTEVPADEIQPPIIISGTDLLRLCKTAAALVEALDQSESNHGGLLTVGMLRKKNELRLELSRWAK